MPWPQEYTDTFKQNLTCIFLSVRFNLKETFQCETPCKYSGFQIPFVMLQEKQDMALLTGEN